MRKTPVWLAVGLVAGAVAMVWLRPSPDTSDHSPDRALAADAASSSEYGALLDRVAELEKQVGALAFAIDALAERLAQEAKRSDSEDANRAAAIRDIQQRLAAPPGVQLDNGTLVLQSNGPAVRIVGPRGGILTAEAVALAAAAGDPLIAPTNLRGVQAQTGDTLVFRVTGGHEGPVWGSDVYTDDSSIGAAAVHAGILRPGETGTIMVTVLNGFPSYAASSRNGIDSNSFGEWERSFSMVRLN